MRYLLQGWVVGKRNVPFQFLCLGVWSDRYLHAVWITSGVLGLLSSEQILTRLELVFLSTMTLYSLHPTRNAFTVEYNELLSSDAFVVFRGGTPLTLELDGHMNAVMWQGSSVSSAEPWLLGLEGCHLSRISAPVPLLTYEDRLFVTPLQFGLVECWTSNLGVRQVFSLNESDCLLERNPLSLLCTLQRNVPFQRMLLNVNTSTCGWILVLIAYSRQRFVYTAINQMEVPFQFCCSQWHWMD